MKRDVPFRHSCPSYFIRYLLFQRVRKGALKPVPVLVREQMRVLAVICLKKMDLGTPSIRKYYDYFKLQMKIYDLY